jgi:hypothetical protein
MESGIYAESARATVPASPFGDSGEGPIAGGNPLPIIRGAAPDRLSRPKEATMRSNLSLEGVVTVSSVDLASQAVGVRTPKGHTLVTVFPGIKLEDIEVGALLLCGAYTGVLLCAASNCPVSNISCRLSRSLFSHAALAGPATSFPA